MAGAKTAVYTSYGISIRSSGGPKDSPHSAVQDFNFQAVYVENMSVATLNTYEVPPPTRNPGSATAHTEHLI